MPLERVETYTTTGTKTSWNLDPSIAPFSVGISCELSSGGTVDYKLQYSYDTLNDPTATDDDATWYDSTDIPGGTTASKATTFATPIARVRVVIAALTGSLKMIALQGFSIN